MKGSFYIKCKKCGEEKTVCANFKSVPWDVEAVAWMNGHGCGDVFVDSEEGKAVKSLADVRKAARHWKYLMQ